MKREEIKAIFAEATDEQLDKIMSLNGSDIEKFKSDVAGLKAELSDKKTAFGTLNSEFEALKTSNASAEDYKKKFEELNHYSSTVFEFNIHFKNLFLMNNTK